MLEMILRYGNYHFWSQDQSWIMIEAAGMPEEAVTPFLHTIAVDKLWLERIEHGGRPALDELTDFAEAKELMIELKKQWKDFFDGLTNEAMAGEITFQNTRGISITVTLGEILMHVFNHGTYHRGQVARAVRLSGGEPISTDLLDFLRQK
ncbi:MAG: DinB family protein [bacterium]